MEHTEQDVKAKNAELEKEKALMEQIANLKKQNQELSKNHASTLEQLKKAENKEKFTKAGYSEKYHKHLEILADKFGIDEVLQDKTLDNWKASIDTHNIEILNQGTSFNDNANPQEIKDPMKDIFDKAIESINNIN